MIDSFFVQLAFKFNITLDFLHFGHDFSSRTSDSFTWPLHDLGMNLHKHLGGPCIPMEVNKQPKRISFFYHLILKMAKHTETIADLGKAFRHPTCSAKLISLEYRLAQKQR